MKVVYLATAPLPYDTPILNALSDLVDLHVIYMSGHHALSSFTDVWGEPPRFTYSTHRSMALRVPWVDFWTQFSLGISRQLNRLDPDIVLSKSWNPFTLEPLLWKRLRRRRFVMWSESTRFSGLLRGRVSTAIRRSILAQVDWFVTCGSQATAFLLDLGVDRRRIITACLTSGLTERALASNAWEAAAPAAETGPRFLFVGRLIPLKRPFLLLEAFERALAELPSATLTIVGEGLLREEIAQIAGRLGDRVRMLGWAEGPELSERYREADVLVIPSVREVWGLVVNEALAHGLYVIATDQVGSAYDLLDDASGAMVPADDVAALATAMLRAGSAVRRSPGVRSVRARRLATCTAIDFAQAIHRAAKQALNRGAGRRCP